MESNCSKNKPLPQIHGLYKHYKGKIYKVIAIGYNSESDNVEPWISYQGLYKDPQLGDNPVFFQSLDRFFEPVSIDGGQKARFTLLQSYTHTDAQTTLQELKNAAEEFVHERDWEQFHTPKNLAIALMQEASELSEFFTWVESSRSRERLEEKRTEVEHEVADVLLILLAFANRHTIDLSSAFINKLVLSKKKYPAHLCRGKTDKYTTYIKT